MCGTYLGNSKVKEPNLHGNVKEKFSKGKYEYITYERKAAKNQGTVQKLCWKPEKQTSDVPTYMKEITNLTILIINNNFEYTVSENGHTDRVRLIAG